MSNSLKKFLIFTGLGAGLVFSTGATGDRFFLNCRGDADIEGDIDIDDDDDDDDDDVDIEIEG